MPHSDLKLTILFLREGPLTVAQCLEYDIAAQGDGIDEALRAWGDVLAGQIIVDIRAGREPLSDVRPAPDYYFDMVPRSKRLADPTPVRLPDDVPPAWMLHAMHPELRVLL
jgi:hypothetical protein